MICKSVFPKDWLGYQLNRWIVNIQLYDCLELVKTSQQWVAREKREASKHYFIKENKRFLSGNLTAQLWMCCVSIMVLGAEF